MDKTMLRGYIREIVREELNLVLKSQVSEILSSEIGQIISEIKSAKGPEAVEENKKPSLSREELKKLLSNSYDKISGTIVASTDSLRPDPYDNTDTTAELRRRPDDDPVKIALTKDYSKVLRDMGVVK